MKSRPQPDLGHWHMRIASAPPFPQGRLASLLAALGAARGPSAPGGRGSAGV